MPTFKPPVYSKQTNASNQVESSYVFPVEIDNGLEHLTEDPIDASVLQQCIGLNKDWVDQFITDFLKQSATYFSKQYTLQDMLKIIQHRLVPGQLVHVPHRTVFIPKQVQILGKVFFIHWTYECKPFAIDIPGLSDPLPDSSVAELNMDELPMDSTESMTMENPNRLLEKQKVKEALLKAKVAYYRAQNKLRSYSDKYGDEYSDSGLEEDTEQESEEDS